MRPFIDFTGKRFGRLIVIKNEGRNKGGKSIWLCQCDCGNKTVVVGYDLQINKTQSCGCYKKDRIRETKFKDLTGQVFGYLTVIRFIEFKNHQAQWLCQCKCGKQVISTCHNLKSGNTKSCGCFNKERIRETHTMDYTGKTIGKLSVIKEVSGSTLGNERRWLCKCICGNEITIKTSSLSNRRNRNCGCLMYKLPKGQASFNAIVLHMQRNAKKRNLEWNISHEKVLDLVQQNCFYCGSPPLQIKKTGKSNGSFIYNGIDRIDSAKGYTVDNVVSCCGTCNKAKSNKNKDEFRTWINQVHNYWAKIPNENEIVITNWKNPNYDLISLAL